MANDPPRWESDDCDDPIHERHWADVVSLSWAFCADDDESWPCAAILVHEAAVGYVPPARPVAAPRDGHANPSGALESPGPLTAQQLTDGPLSTTWRPGRRGSTRHQGMPKIAFGRRKPRQADAGVGSSAQALQLPAEALARPALAPDSHDPRPDLRDHRRRAVVHVARHGDRGADARLDRPHDLDDALAPGDQRVDPVASPDLCRRLRGVPVHEDVAGVTELRRRRARLHEPHRAQPAVDAGLVRRAGISHAL